MSILEKIKNDQVDARKKQDKWKLSVLSTLFAEVERVGKDKNNTETSDVDAITMVQKFIKNNKDCLQYTKDQAKIDNINRENEVFYQYVPKQLSAEDMKNIITENNLSGVPAIMGHFKKNHFGTYDSATLLSVAKPSA